MVLRHFLVALALLASSYSYCSDIVYGSTNNAASTGYQWVMTNVLPQQAGLEVTGVVYRYTTVKNTEDPMLVTVQNKNALSTGYIFRSTDDWSGLPSNTLNKFVPTSSIPIEYWGNGEIAIEGQGEVKDANIIYNYQYDPCFDPQSNPECPRYINTDFTIATTVIEYIEEDPNKPITYKDDEQEEADSKKRSKEKKKERLEVALQVVSVALMTAEAVAQAEALLSMNAQIVNYELNNIPGGTYLEDASYLSAQLPDNNSGARNGLAQQILHNEMVESQYKSEK